MRLAAAVLLALPLHAASLPLNLTPAPGAEFTTITLSGVRVAAVKPLDDYYQRAAAFVRIPTPQPKSWISVAFLDRGYGLISTSPAPAEQWNVARLNTGKVRRAWFRFDKPLSELRIYGAAYIASLALSDSEPPREPIPAVKPALVLQRPMDLVISAGADASTPEGLQQSLATMRQLLPLAKALGFNGIESYVKWNFVERSPGVWDWSFYDALVAEMEKHGFKWFPLLIVGSAYALPQWFFESPDMVGYKCLEHNQRIEIPTIFSDHQVKYVRRFLSEFGKHYGSRSSLLGVRLGPSANYGEAQYPATGAWGYRNRGLHTHLGYWAGDEYASPAFQRWLRERYSTVADINKVWDTEYTAFDAIRTFLPITANTPRMRLDFSNWYMAAMADWCEKWATWAREAMPNVPIYQSSGGWGAIEIGTDYTAHTKSMARLKGGIRLTNENDSFLNNVGATKLAASAAHFYGAKVGYEPAGFSSARGVVGRIFNSLINDSSHLFYYYGNIFGDDLAPERWLQNAPLLDRRARPASGIAVFYPDTDIRLSDEVLRHLRASAFFQRIQAFRSVADFDFVSEQMTLDGALDRYQALVFVWTKTTEKPVLEKIDAWVRAGGVAYYPARQHMRDGGLFTVEGDRAIWDRWQRGETGKGRVVFFKGHPEPVHYYIDFLRAALPRQASLSPAVRAALTMNKPQETYWSVLENGATAILNYDDAEAAVTLNGKTLRISPYSVAIQ